MLFERYQGKKEIPLLKQKVELFIGIQLKILLYWLINKD